MNLLWIRNKIRTLCKSLFSAAINMYKCGCACVLTDAHTHPVVLASARVRVRSICASRARQARSELDALYHQAWLQKNAGLQKQTNKFAEWHYYYNDCYMILPYEKHDNFADQSMKTYKKWEKTTMLHTLHTTHYTIHTHTQYTLLYEYIQLWLWRNDQLLKTIRKIIKTYLFVVPRRYQIPLKSRFLREVSPSSYLGRTQGLAGNSKSIYEVCWS